VVLNQCVEALRSNGLLMVEPVTAENLAARNGKGGGKMLVVADQLWPDEGQLIGICEGSEAANPYWPNPTPVDAYCAMVIDDYDFKPPESGVEGSE